MKQRHHCNSRNHCEPLEGTVATGINKEGFPHDVACKLSPAPADWRLKLCWCGVEGRWGPQSPRVQDGGAASGEQLKTKHVHHPEHHTIYFNWVAQFSNIFLAEGKTSCHIEIFTKLKGSFMKRTKTKQSANITSSLTNFTPEHLRWPQSHFLELSGRSWTNTMSNM